MIVISTLVLDTYLNTFAIVRNARNQVWVKEVKVPLKKHQRDDVTTYFVDQIYSLNTDVSTPLMFQVVARHQNILYKMIKDAFMC